MSKQKITKEILKAAPGLIVELFELDLSKSPARIPNILFHAGEINKFESKALIWQGREYLPLNAKLDGFALKGDGSLPRPTLIISNTEGTISKYLKALGDVTGFKITRRRTFLKYLDGINFPDSVNPYGTPDPDAHFDDDSFVINTKKSENRLSVEFELVSVLELEQVFLPARQIMSDYCSWIYRSEIGCGFRKGKTSAGGIATSNRPVADGNNNKFWAKYPTNSGRPNKIDWNLFWNHEGTEWNAGFFYKAGHWVILSESNNEQGDSDTLTSYICIKDNHNKSPDKNKEYWDKDACAKTLDACKCRFDPQDKGLPIPFGGFPSTAKFGMR